MTILNCNCGVDDKGNLVHECDEHKKANFLN